MIQRLPRLFALLLCLAAVSALSSCGGVRKRITVVVREAGSGTREGFDRAVTDGTNYLEERDASGKKVYRSVKDAVQQTKTGAVLSTVAHDANAIGYVSLDSVSDMVKILSIDGVLPSETSVAGGDYPISRPYVILTSQRIPLSPLAADFLAYLKSDLIADQVRAAGCIFLSDPQKRANEGAEPIPIRAFAPQAMLPTGGRIVIRGSTSLEKLITAAARAYAELYSADPTAIFDVQLEGSSIGRRAVEGDRSGNVIGLSSAAVEAPQIESFNLCLDAIAVIVHPQNPISDLSLPTLYKIFSGEIRHFDELGGAI